MKKACLLAALTALIAAGCGKKADTFAFSGRVVGYVDCTMSSASVSEMDFGYIVDLDTPDSVGGAYASDGKTYSNAVILYRTRARIGQGEEISGTMYLDDNYSRAYCSYHYNWGIPEGVCYTLD